MVDQEFLFRSPARRRLGVRRNREFVRHKKFQKKGVGGFDNHIRELGSSRGIWCYTGLVLAAEGVVMLKCYNEVRTKCELERPLLKQFNV